MKAAVQPARIGCQSARVPPCRGLTTPLRPTESPWEFEGRCERCGAAVLVSWFHGAPAPVFERPQASGQGQLFEGVDLSG